MRGILPALATFFAGVLILSASSRIEDPTSFVTEVYRRLVAAQLKVYSYTPPPSDIYSGRLGTLLRNDRERAKGEVGCLDFVFWVNGQDWTITNLTVTSDGGGLDRKTVIAHFLNIGEPQEIHFDFLRTTGRWWLDDVHSVRAPQWTLSKILKCAS